MYAMYCTAVISDSIDARDYDVGLQHISKDTYRGVHHDPRKCMPEQSTIKPKLRSYSRRSFLSSVRIDENLQRFRVPVVGKSPRRRKLPEEKARFASKNMPALAFKFSDEVQVFPMQRVCRSSHVKF